VLAACGGAPVPAGPEPAAPDRMAAPDRERSSPPEPPTRPDTVSRGSERSIGSIVSEVAASARAEPVLRDFDPRFVGRWRIERWGVSYEIRVVDGELVVTAEDYVHGEAFEVSNVSWRPPELRVTFRMPSTAHATHSVLRVLDGDRIEDRYTGDAEGTDIWQRVE
jgi:hypothetical protein